MTEIGFRQSADIPRPCVCVFRVGGTQHDAALAAVRRKPTRKLQLVRKSKETSIMMVSPWADDVMGMYRYSLLHWSGAEGR